MPKFSEETPYHVILLGHQNKPLKLWNKKIRSGHIHQLLDNDLQDVVLEIGSAKSSHTYITCPADHRKVLGIQAPFLHLTMKNLERSVIIDVQIKDNKNVNRRIRALTKQQETELKPYMCKIPLILEKGWNQVILPLMEFTKRAYGTRYVETLRVQMHATCRIKCIYFSNNPLIETFSS